MRANILGDDRAGGPAAKCVGDETARPRGWGREVPRTRLPARSSGCRWRSGPSGECGRIAERVRTRKAAGRRSRCRVRRGLDMEEAWLNVTQRIRSIYLHFYSPTLRAYFL